MAADKQADIQGKVFGIKELPDDLGEIGIRARWNRYEIVVKIKDDDGHFTDETVVDAVNRDGGAVDDFDQRRHARQIRDDRLNDIVVAMEKLDYPH